MSELKIPYNFVIKQNLSEEVCRIHNEKYGSRAFIDGSFKYLKFKEIDDFKSRYSEHIPEGYVEIDLEEFERLFINKIEDKSEIIEKPFTEFGEITYDMITTHKYFKTLTEKELESLIDRMDYSGYQRLLGGYSKGKAKLLIEKFKTEIMAETAETEKLVYGGNISDFPIEVVEKMLERQVEQGNPRSVEPFEYNRERSGFYGAFTWDITPEGRNFWLAVISNRNFDHFYEKYPKIEKEEINNQINNKTMQVTCISSGSTKNLTEGNSYDVVEENDTFYYVQNDKGVTTRYNKKLFKSEEVIPVEPPKPVIKDVALKIEHFSLIGNFESGSSGVQLKASVEGINKRSINLMTISDCRYSCGILEIEGFNNLVNTFNSYVRELLNEGAAHNLNITVENKFDIFESLFRNLIDKLFEENDSKGIILMSSNITNNSGLNFLCNTSDTDVISEMVSGLFDNSTHTENPNSGNMIFLGVSVR